MAALYTTEDPEIHEFFLRVAETIEQARKFVGRTADLTMTVTYFEVGRMIVEKEQSGKSRAEYGKKLIEGLSRFLTEKYKKGYSETNLRNARKFYLVYIPRFTETFINEQKLSFPSSIPIQQLLTAESSEVETSQKQQLIADEFSGYETMKQTARFSSRAIGRKAS